MSDNNSDKHENSSPKTILIISRIDKHLIVGACHGLGWIGIGLSFLMLVFLSASITCILEMINRDGFASMLMFCLSIICLPLIAWFQWVITKETLTKSSLVYDGITGIYTLSTTFCRSANVIHGKTEAPPRFSIIEAYKEGNLRLNCLCILLNGEKELAVGLYISGSIKDCERERDRILRIYLEGDSGTEMASCNPPHPPSV